MNIGIDIDGVLTDIENWQICHGSKFCLEKSIGSLVNINSYMSKEMFDWSQEIDDEFWESKIFDYAKNEKMRCFANEVIKKLMDEGNKIYIITARSYTTEDSMRGRKMRKTVRNWLNKNDIPYTQIVYSGDSKVYACETLKIDIMIDDYSKNINMLKDTVKNLICFDARHNKDIDLPNVIRAYSWYDIYDKIKKIQKNV